MMVRFLCTVLFTTSAALDGGHAPIGVTAGTGWHEDSSLTLAAALVRNAQAPVFSARDGGWCVDIGRWTPAGKPTQWIWAHCPPSTDAGAATPPCSALETEAQDLSVLAEKCPAEAVELAELEQASCNSTLKFEELLRQPATLNIHLPKSDDFIESLRGKIDRGPFQAERIGCASTVTSIDNRVRSWTLKMAERRQEESVYQFDNAERGQAYIQWLDSSGGVQLEPDGAWEDLSLDSAIDGIVPIPGLAKQYLVTGYLYRGYHLLRFAELVSLSGQHPARLKGKFLVRDHREDVLLVSGGRPETGKARHSPVYNHWMRFKESRIWMEPIGDECCHAPTKPFVIARWSGRDFRTTESAWAKILRQEDIYK